VAQVEREDMLRAHVTGGTYAPPDSGGRDRGGRYAPGAQVIGGTYAPPDSVGRGIGGAMPGHRAGLGG
jgi:hypothetical protein